jgi:hypothetical protein
MTALSGYGISLEQPSGWYGEIFRDTDGIDDTGPVVHLANTPMIVGDHDLYASETRQIMRPTDAIVTIVNLPSLPNIVAAGATQRLGPARGWSLRGADGTGFSGVATTQSSMRKTVHVAERVFDLVTFFGTPEPASDLVAAVNAILGTVRIDPSARDRGQRIEQYFSVGAAVRIHEEVRRAVWARDSAFAAADEVEEHRRAFP